MRRVIDDPRLDRDRHTRGSFLSFAVDIEAAMGGDVEQLRGDARESLAIATELACSSCAAQALVSLLLVDDCDDLGGPVAVARRSLQLADSIQETMGVIRALDMLVGALAADGDAATAVRVAAATDRCAVAPATPSTNPDGAPTVARGLDAARSDPHRRRSSTRSGGRASRIDYPHLIDELLLD